MEEAKTGIVKVGLLGSAGLGKSGIAQRISQAVGLRFLRSKDITRPVLTKYGYDYGMGGCVENFLSRRDIEFEIVRRRLTAEEECINGFVTDRTTLECFAYAMLNVEKYSCEDIGDLEEMCRGNMKKYTHLFYFPQSMGWLEENGVRTVNEYFQWKVDMLICGLLKDWGIRFIDVSSYRNVENGILKEIGYGIDERGS